MTTITLHTKPLILNHKHIPVNGRLILTSAWRASKQAMEWEIASQWKNEPLEGDVTVNVIYYHKNKTHGDIDAYLKMLLDAMEGVVYKNDKQINELHVFREFDKENPRTELQIL